MKLFIKIKLFLLKIKWVLFGKNKPFNKAVKEVNEVVYGKPTKPKKVYKISNSHYSSTKRHNR